MGSIHYNVIVISAVTVLFVGACTVEPTDQAILTTPTAPVEQEDLALNSEVRLHEEIKRERVQAADALVPAHPSKQRFDYYTALPASEMAQLRAPSEPVNRENYAHFSDNPLHRVVEDPFSTFSIDVDTGAYSNMRRMLNAGNRPV
ncbi:MAG: von Willebrand factor type A domain-containing protein, partial [Pseudomonadota bacterium]